jgi:TDG/mug DNA glycosylase family protein
VRATALRVSGRIVMVGAAREIRLTRGRAVQLARAARGSADAAVVCGARRASAWPALLARVHAALRPGGSLVFALRDLDAALGRELLEGAGFAALRRLHTRSFGPALAAQRAHTLPDFVQPRLDLLICGLNPSLHAARTGIPFSRPGNRFWPAALRAGLLVRDRDPLAALERGIGFTDFCKRATRRAGELRPAEYVHGRARLERLVQRLRPRALCFVGLQGWRHAVSRDARPGWVPRGFAGRPAYLMPSTSGLNAHASLAELTADLARAYTGARC